MRSAAEATEIIGTCEGVVDVAPVEVAGHVPHPLAEELVG